MTTPLTMRPCRPKLPWQMKAVVAVWAVWQVVQVWVVWAGTHGGGR